MAETHSASNQPPANAKLPPTSTRDGAQVLKVEHLDVGPGDRLLLRLPAEFGPDVLERIVEQFRKEFPENRLVVLAGGIELSVEPADAPEVKRIDIAEFRAEGYLQEANRRFFHPLGLALEVVVENDGTERLGGVWDYRDDPEGIHYDGGADLEKAERITRLFADRATAREDALGFVIEPVGDDAPPPPPPPTPGLGRPEVSG